MHEDNRKDIYDEEIDYSYISLISSKIRVGIIGGGRAGAIKAKHFVKNKYYVEVLAQHFSDDIVELFKGSNGRIKLINDDFSYEFLKDKHLIVIALDDKDLKFKIKKYCDDNYKIYIDSSNFNYGMAVVPVQRSTKNMMVALNTKGGNPKGAVLVCNKIKEVLEEYDGFIEFTTKLRNRAKELPEHKDDILKFIGTEEFKRFYDEGKSEEIIRTNFSQEISAHLLKARYL